MLYPELTKALKNVRKIDKGKEYADSSYKQWVGEIKSMHPEIKNTLLPYDIKGWRIEHSTIKYEKGITV